MSTRCIAAGVFLLEAAKHEKWGLVGKVVQPDAFSSAVQQTLRAVKLQISRLDYRASIDVTNSAPSGRAYF
jgi:hypothetical protein